MRLKSLCLAVACGLFSLGYVAVLPAQDAAAQQYTPVAVLPKLELQDGDSIVFLGDSITHQCLYTQYVEDYFYTRFPQMRLKLHNAGVGGARAWDALARFDKDVAAYKPKYVTILLGMNDGSYRPFDQGVFDTYQQDMSKLLARLEEIGAKPIPMTPTMFDARARRLGNKTNPNDPSATLYNSVLSYYGTWLRDVSAEKGYGFVDMWSPLNNITLEQRKTDPAFTLIRDAVHPEADGQLVMATAIVNDLGLSRKVSGIKLHLKGDKWTGNGVGGKVTEISGSADTLSFTFHATALPWVLPPAAAKGVELTKLGHRLSGETVEIHGLAPGKYTLSIDGTEVGTYSHDALARHIELQGNDKTPQYQQALAIALLNEQRNNGPVQRLRGEWGQFQGYARTQQALENNPNDEGAKKRLAEMEPRISSMDERVAQWNAEAKAIEDDIFTKNQPVARKYELKRAAE